MVLLGGHLRCKIILYELHSKLLVPMFQKPTVRFIRSSTSHHDKESSAPVRYIPKKSTHLEQVQTSLTSNKFNEGIFENFNDSIKLSPKMKRIGNKNSKKKAQSLAPDMFYGDDTKFIESEEEEEEELKLTSKSEEDAEKVAVAAIAARALTAVELRNKLNAKGFTSDVIERLLTNMQSKGYINDYLYAESFSQSRWSSLTWGPKRIKQALQRKGISESDAQKATKHVFEGGNFGDENGESALGMSKLSIDHLFVQASKQWLRSQNVPLEKRKSRLIRWLLYRGFNWGVINVILKKLQSQYPS